MIIAQFKQQINGEKKTEIQMLQSKTVLWSAEPSSLTVMTDTPAAVLLGLGPVLKCFLIFPATDSCCSFPVTPSSWKTQANPQLLRRAAPSHRNTGALLSRWDEMLTLTHGWSSTCIAVNLCSTSTCSITVIRA